MLENNHNKIINKEMTNGFHKVNEKYKYTVINTKKARCKKKKNSQLFINFSIYWIHKYYQNHQYLTSLVCIVFYENDTLISTVI